MSRRSERRTSTRGSEHPEGVPQGCSISLPGAGAVVPRLGRAGLRNGTADDLRKTSSQL